MIFITNVFTKVTQFIYSVILGKHLKPMEANQENNEPNLEQNKELQETQTYESWVKPKMTTSFAQDKQELLDNYLKTIPEDRRPKNISQFILYLLTRGSDAEMLPGMEDELNTLKAKAADLVDENRDMLAQMLEREKLIESLTNQVDDQAKQLDILREELKKKESAAQEEEQEESFLGLF